MEKILFLDLDGTIIETKSGNKFPKDTNDWKFKSGILSAIYNCYKNLNFDTLTIITNQAGIDEGYYRPKDVVIKVNEICSNIAKFIFLQENPLSNEARHNFEQTFAFNYLISPSLGNQFRKPKFILKDHIEFEDFDNKRSLMVGDASGILRETNKVVHDKICDILRNSLSEGKNLEFVNAELFKEVEGILYKIRCNFGSCTYYELKRDFSDSDKEFAENNKIPYLDVEEFIKKYRDKNKS